MMVGATKIRIDENEADKLTKVKKIGVAAKEPVKRAALGDLQNRGVLRAAAGKDAAQKDLNDAKLKHASAHVLKKAPTVTGGAKAPLVQPNTSNGTTGTMVTAKAVAGAHARKPLTRTSSLRVPSSSASTAVSGAASSLLQRHGTNSLMLGHNKPKTLTTKVVENKVHQVKLITKCKASVEEKTTKVITKSATIRREDSNLSRQSLSKLKAALSRDGSKVPAAKSTAVSVAKVDTKLPQTTAELEPTVSASSEQKIISQPASVQLKIVSVQTHSAQLLNAVEDIDAEDGDKLLLVSEYVNDIYNYLFQLETEQAIRPDHLAEQEEVFPKMRAVLIDWINEVHFQFHLAPETFQMAVAIIDRYLQAVCDTKRSHLQLVGVTALFIAAKYEELYPPPIADFVFITDDTYNAKQILQMELKIFKTLDCNLSRPLPIHFLRRFSKAGKAEDVHHAMSKYFLELTAVEYDLVAYKPSEIAAASLFLTLHLLTDNAKEPTGFNNKHWTPTLEWYSRYSAEHLRPITRKIANVVRNADSAKLKAVYNKHQSSKFHKISLRSELYGALIDSIISSKD